MRRDDDSEGFSVPSDSAEAGTRPSPNPEPTPAKKPAKVKAVVVDHTRDDHHAPQTTAQDIVASTAHMREILRGRRIADKARKDRDVAFLLERIEQLESELKPRRKK